MFKLFCGAALAVALPLAAMAQTTISDPPGTAPDPTHIPFTLPKNIVWGGTPKVQEIAKLYGDPDKAGPYGLLIKWYPGNFSRPHFHSTDRWVYVVSGTWWVSSGQVFDEKTTYPFHAGTFATDLAKTVHWDGARTGEKEPAVILLTGIGPVVTTQLDGK
jgi:hypothetical protein